MDRLMRIEQWQVDMAKRTPPSVDTFVQGSTPVISFGDPLTAEVATIGINPSRREFDDGGWLRGSKRRLATLDSLGAAPGQELTQEQARQAVEDCNRYFDHDRNHYHKWFGPLDKLLAAAIGGGYGDGTACHLDLVQWATDPVWGKLANRADKEALLREGRPHLELLLARSNVRLILANGRAVVDQLQRIGIVRWQEIGRLPLGLGTCTLLQSQGDDSLRYVGWSTNLQAGRGVSNEFKERLAAAIAPLAAPVVVRDLEPGTSDGRLEVDASGHLPRVLRVVGKEQLTEALRRWYDESDAATVGDVGLFGGRPAIAIAIDLGDKTAVLNVDTKRSAVAAYLEHARTNGVDAPWRVVANTRGNVNKVIFSDEPAAAAGWYVYLRKPLVEPATL
ncbi:hypothetical protein ACFFOM_15380 [Microlunatus capsulatus]|uniref:Uncharacterized protein n=1 Tax=Microlunatus capsulatus TaxID=99117 RepID=A0ABS4Z810_9ACTN|nr:hypothetical protein [Microlunatus capsulatus]MBP2416870.1 hypothetical protein [Microlunatus capsulatus]